jgi:hypothetical protein
MMRLMLILSLAILAGCEAGTGPQTWGQTAAVMFGPAAMRIHPIFTRVKDWTGDNSPDGIEALIEFQDQFGDPTKASGTVRFELYAFRPYNPDPRGSRIIRWTGSLQTLEQQRAQWNRTSRTYSFRLEHDRINPRDNYVLSAQFDLSDGGRFFDQIVLEAQPVSAR